MIVSGLARVLSRTVGLPISTRLLALALMGIELATLAYIPQVARASHPGSPTPRPSQGEGNYRSDLVIAGQTEPTISWFPVPRFNEVPTDIIQGPDGNLWFT